MYIHHLLSYPYFQFLLGTLIAISLHIAPREDAEIPLLDECGAGAGAAAALRTSEMVYSTARLNELGVDVSTNAHQESTSSMNYQNGPRTDLHFLQKLLAAFIPSPAYDTNIAIRLPENGG